MKVILVVFALLALGCQKEDVGIFHPGALVQDAQGTVIRVTSGDMEGNFTGIIVDAINPGAVCDEVTAIKTAFLACDDCRDYCIQ